MNHLKRYFLLEDKLIHIVWSFHIKRTFFFCSVENILKQVNRQKKDKALLVYHAFQAFWSNDLSGFWLLAKTNNSSQPINLYSLKCWNDVTFDYSIHLPTQYENAWIFGLRTKWLFECHTWDATQRHIGKSIIYSN